jgi:hypothetical protein
MISRGFCVWYAGCNCSVFPVVFCPSPPCGSPSQPNQEGNILWFTPLGLCSGNITCSLKEQYHELTGAFYIGLFTDANRVKTKYKWLRS